MGNDTDKEQLLILMGKSTQVNLRMVKNMVKEHKLGLMETSMQGDLRRTKDMEKVHTNLINMEKDVYTKETGMKVEELDKVPKHVQKESGGLFFMKEDGKIANFMVKGNQL